MPSWAIVAAVFVLRGHAGTLRKELRREGDGTELRTRACPTCETELAAADLQKRNQLSSISNGLGTAIASFDSELNKERSEMSAYGQATQREHQQTKARMETMLEVAKGQARNMKPLVKDIGKRMEQFMKSRESALKQLEKDASKEVKRNGKEFVKWAASTERAAARWVGGKDRDLTKYKKTFEKDVDSTTKKSLQDAQKLQYKLEDKAEAVNDVFADAKEYGRQTTSTIDSLTEEHDRIEEEVEKGIEETYNGDGESGALGINTAIEQSGTVLENLLEESNVRMDEYLGTTEEELNEDSESLREREQELAAEIAGFSGLADTRVKEFASMVADLVGNQESNLGQMQKEIAQEVRDTSQMFTRANTSLTSALEGTDQMNETASNAIITMADNMDTLIKSVEETGETGIATIDQQFQDQLRAKEKKTRGHR